MAALWPDWGGEIFERARREKKPILAHFDSSSRPSSRRFQVLLADPRVARVVSERFIPMRIQADERPDLAARVGLGETAPLAAVRADAGWVTFFPQDEAGALSSALLAFAESYRHASGDEPAPGPVWNGAVSEASHPAEVGPSWPVSVAAAVKGLPAGAFPCLDCLEFLLFAAAEWKDAAAGELALARLDLLSKGDFWDKERGGFSAPDKDKNLPLNARLSRLYWDAHALSGRDFLKDFGLRTLDFMLQDLYSGMPGAFLLSRRDAGAPKFYADANAMAALALLRAGAFPEGKRFSEPTQRLLELLTQWFDPHKGMAHVWDGAGTTSVWGLLGDGAWAMLALTESFLSGGPTSHRDFADRILKHLFQNLWERERGGFLDRPPGPEDFGVLKQPFTPIQGNAVAIEAAWRLHQLMGNSHYKQWAEYGMRSLIGKCETSGCEAAPLARVQDILGKGRLDFELVGRPGEQKTMDLLAALNRHYLPRKIVSFVSPDDQDYIMAHKLEAETFPVLFACVNLKPIAKAHTPAEVPTLLKPAS